MTQNAQGFVSGFLRERMVTHGGRFTVTVSLTSSGLTVIKSDITRLCKVVVAQASNNIVRFYDSASAASGTIIGYIPPFTPAGTAYGFDMPCVFGIVMSGTIGPGQYIVSYR